MSLRNYKRRAFLRASGGAFGACLWPFTPRLVLAATGDLALTSLSERLSVVTGAGSNVVVLETESALALVDSGAPEQADALASFIDAQFDGKPVRTLFNTNWRLPFTGGNDLFASRGATIIAHENTRLWMGTEYFVEWEQKNYAPRAGSALPTETFYSSDPQPLTHELDGISIEYGHLAEAFTDGDIYVRFADDNVLAVGGVLAVDAFPLLDYSTGGWIGGCQSATRQLLDMCGDQTRIVAGAGQPQSRSALADQAEMLDELRERIRLRIIEGKSVDEILAENVMDGYEHLPNPRRFVANVYNGLWWGGRLRGAY